MREQPATRLVAELPPDLVFDRLAHPRRRLHLEAWAHVAQLRHRKARKQIAARAVDKARDVLRDELERLD